MSGSDLDVLDGWAARAALGWRGCWTTLTPRVYGHLDQQAARVFGLPDKEPDDDGICYGLLYCETDSGEPVTIATPDLTSWRMIWDASAPAPADTTLTPQKFPLSLAWLAGGLGGGAPRVRFLGRV